MEAIKINLADLLRGRDEGFNAKPRPLPEAQVMELKETFAVFEAECQFRPGDLVTPRENSGYTNAGEPHIVLEVADVPIRNLHETSEVSHNSSGFGNRLDIRVAVIADDGSITPFWQESYRMKPYIGPKS